MTEADRKHPFERILQLLEEKPWDRALRVERSVLVLACAAYEKALQAVEDLEEEGYTEEEELKETKSSLIIPGGSWEAKVK